MRRPLRGQHGGREEPHNPRPYNLAGPGCAFFERSAPLRREIPALKGIHARHWGVLQLEERSWAELVERHVDGSLKVSIPPRADTDMCSCVSIVEAGAPTRRPGAAGEIGPALDSHAASRPSLPADRFCTL